MISESIIRYTLYTCFSRNYKNWPVATKLAREFARNAENSGLIAKGRGAVLYQEMMTQWSYSASEWRHRQAEETDNG